MKKDLNKIVWENIKSIRNNQKITQLDLAEKLWVNRSRIAQIESWSQNLTLNTLQIISEVLWVDIVELLR